MKRFVLVCSGGGVRGILTLSFLNNLESFLGTPLFTMVDLVCGTSTGGFVASGIASGMTSDDILKTLYTTENASYIFSKRRFMYYLGLASKYSDKPKKELLANTFQTKTIHDISIPLVIPTFNDSKDRLFCWTNIELYNAYVKDILNATSAAPTFFPCASVPLLKPRRTEFMNIQNILPSSDDVYIDGGVCENDPCVLAYAYAKKVYPEDEIYILSVGTGKSIIKENKKSGLIHWLTHGFTDILMDGGNQTNVIELEILLGNRFLACDVTIDNSKMDDTTPENIERLKQEGDTMWETYIPYIQSFFNALTN